MNLPKISILIPTYNRATMLAEAIESCLAQDYSNMEVVISDNASTDETPSVVQHYLTDSRVRHFRQDPGIPAADNWLNLLYEYAQGDYAQLLCDDDLLADKHYLSEVAELIAKTGVKAVLSFFQCVDLVSGKRGSENSLTLPRVVRPETWIEILGTAPNGSYFFPCLPTVYHLEQARALQAYKPQVSGLDFEITMRFMLAGEVGWLNRPYCIARAHGDNRSRTKDQAEDFLEGAKMFERFYEQGAALGFSHTSLMAAKRRLMVLYLRTFLLPAWLRERGNSPRSLRECHSRIAALDGVVARQFFSDFRTIGKIILFNHPLTYQTVGRLVNRNMWKTMPHTNRMTRSR